MTMKKPNLAVIPTDPIEFYLETGYGAAWLKSYFNPCGYFDKVYILSPHVKDNPDILGFQEIRTEPAQLRQRIKELDIQMVRAYGGFWPSDMACSGKVDGVPVIVSVHDTKPDLLHDSIKRADFVFCMSQSVRELVLKKFNKPERVWVLPNRVNFDVMRHYSKEECRDLDAKYPFRFRLVLVGRKTPQKNLDNLIKALKILGPDYCLLAVGKKSSEDYESLARQQGVAERCFFIESIVNDELARYYSWADCMCTPSRWEGFGIVFIEALACGAVIVTSDIAPMNEYMTDGENGVLVKDYENPQALAKAVSSACNDQKLRESIKAKARLSVEKFEKSRVDRLEVEYYEKSRAIGPNVRGFSEKLVDYAKYRLSQVIGRS